MCLVLLGLDAHPRYTVVMAANRDEFHARPAARAAWWDEGWLAGRDLEAGGTWLGITRKGRWAVITNVREPGQHDPGAPSRGALVLHYLAHPADSATAMREVVLSGERHNGFNLLGGEPDGAPDRFAAHWGSNRGPACRALEAGVYGLSNRLLDTPWPKVVRIKAAFDHWCHRRDGEARSDTADLFDMLYDRTVAPDAELPSTGVGLERERMISAPFIVSPTYGTRSSTVLTIDRDGHVRFTERSFTPQGEATGEVAYDFRLA